MLASIPFAAAATLNLNLYDDKQVVVDHYNNIINPPQPTAQPIETQQNVQHKHDIKRVIITKKRTVTKTKRYKNKHGQTRYRKVHATHTYHRYGYTNGLDCWGMSNLIYGKLTSKGTRARIIQYATSMSARHRSVQVYDNGGWVNYDYGGYSKIYSATSNHGKVIK